MMNNSYQMQFKKHLVIRKIISHVLNNLLLFFFRKIQFI